MDQDLRASDLVSLASRLEAGKFVEVQRDGLSAPAQEFREILWQELRLVAQHLHHSRETLLLASALDPRWKSLQCATSEEVAGVKVRLIREAARLRERQAVPQPKRPRHR